MELPTTPKASATNTGVSHMYPICVCPLWRPTQQQLWMLKTAQHLGKGLRLLPADRGIAEASNEKLKSRGEKPYVQVRVHAVHVCVDGGR